jgi:hypothetical protein
MMLRIKRRRRTPSQRKQYEQAAQIRESATRNISSTADAAELSGSEENSVETRKRGRGPCLSSREAWSKIDEWRKVIEEREANKVTLEQERIDLERQKLKMDQERWDEEHKDRQAQREKDAKMMQLLAEIVRGSKQ